MGTFLRIIYAYFFSAWCLMEFPFTCWWVVPHCWPEAKGWVYWLIADSLAAGRCIDFNGPATGLEGGCVIRTAGTAAPARLLGSYIPQRSFWKFALLILEDSFFSVVRSLYSLFSSRFLFYGFFVCFAYDLWWNVVCGRGRAGWRRVRARLCLFCGCVCVCVCIWSQKQRLTPYWTQLNPTELNWRASPLGPPLIAIGIQSHFWFGNFVSEIAAVSHSLSFFAHLLEETLPGFAPLLIFFSPFCDWRGRVTRRGAAFCVMRVFLFLFRSPVFVGEFFLLSGTAWVDILRWEFRFPLQFSLWALRVRSFSFFFFLGFDAMANIFNLPRFVAILHWPSWNVVLR